MDQYKKVANCVYGKTLQNVRDYTKVLLHTKRKSAVNAVSQPTYKHHTIITPELIQTVHNTEFITHDKPTSIGFTILELSKFIMYDFYYNKLTTNKSFEVDLGMSDTDSFLFSVTNPENYWNHIESFIDYSNYPKNHPKFTDNNKAQLGFFKDELAGKSVCKGFIGLRSKCYSMLLESKESKTIEEKKFAKA